MIDAVIKVARKAARRYARRCWWAEVEDLEQEGALAALRAAKSWDPAVGVPIEAYLWRAAVVAMRTSLWKNSAPVSAPGKKVSELRGAHRADLIPEEHFAPSTPDSLIEEATRADEVFFEVVDAVGHGPDSMLGIEVLLGEKKAREVASARGVAVERVYRAAQEARRAVAEDRACYELWRSG